MYTNVDPDQSARDHVVVHQISNHPNAIRVETVQDEPQTVKDYVNDAEEKVETAFDNLLESGEVAPDETVDLQHPEGKSTVEKIVDKVKESAQSVKDAIAPSSK